MRTYSSVITFAPFVTYLDLEVSQFNSHELDLSWQEVVDLPPEDEAEGGSVVVAKAHSQAYKTQA